MFKRGDGCILATLYYDNDSYTVSIEPKPNGFEATDVRDTGNKRVTGEKKNQLMSVAVRELMIWYRSKLTQPSHVRVPFGERVSVAFALTLYQLEDDVRAKLTPLGRYDLRLLEQTAVDISASIKKANIDAKATSRKLESGYVNELKRDQLKRLGKIVLCNPERRDFYSSVLSRVFAWKGGRIPREDYETAQRYLPGLLIAFSLQG